MQLPAGSILVAGPVIIENGRGDITNVWAWHDINNLPADCAENVFKIIDEYKKSL